MEEARKKPKIQLLRMPEGAEGAEAWSRLIKALKTFTDLDDRVLDAPLGGCPSTEGFDAIFLDTAAAPWSELRKSPVNGLCLVEVRSADWTDPGVRAARLDVCVSHPTLVLEELGAADLLRIIHLFLTPKRLAGTTPLVPKGSLVLGEKVLEPNGVGLLLDRISTFLEKVEEFQLRERIPDLRQVLTALLLEGLTRAREKGANYPYVDFQLSPASEKLVVNLRFPRGSLDLARLSREILTGTNLLWTQIWQSSDVLLLTHHRTQDELEVMSVLVRPERNLSGAFRSLLTKAVEASHKREDLLTPPAEYRFMLVNEIVAKDGSDVHLFTGGDEDFADLALAELPEAVVTKIRQLQEKSQVLNDHVHRKDAQVQELTKKNQDLLAQLNQRRHELIKATQAKEAAQEQSERRARDYESALAHAREAGAASFPREQANAGAQQELLSRLEGMLRAAENEKTHLKEAVGHEQRRLSQLEAKYAQLHKDLSAREREITELKSAVNRLRRDSEKPARAANDDKKESGAGRLKELEDREATHRVEIKRLAYKLESQEKNLKVVQTDATEKQKLLEQKLKSAKLKEMELLRRIEELTASLKKASKVA